MKKQTETVPASARDMVEKTFLGCVMSGADEAVQVAIASGLDNPEMIAHPIVRLTYKTILEMIEDGEPVEMPSVFNRLCRGDGTPQHRASYIALLEECQDLAVCPQTASYYAAEIVRYAMSDMISRATVDVGQALKSADEPADVALGVAGKLLGLVDRFTPGRKSRLNAQEALNEALKHADILRKADPSQIALFGIPEIDCQIGLPPGTLITIAGRPSSGKSALAGQMAVQSAMRGDPVLFVSLEMSVPSIVLRCLACISGVPMHAITGTMTASEYSMFCDAKTRFASFPITFIGRGTCTLNSLVAEVSAVIAREKIRTLIVDYVQLVLPSRKTDSREQEVAATYAALRRLAADHGISVVAVAQLNRECERTGREPRLSDIRESGAAEADSDIVLLIHSRDDENPNNVRFIFAKNRHGRRFSTDVFFDRPAMRFISLNKPL